MLRGRHRGLPVAIDRAVMLPFEFQSNEDTPDNETPMEEDHGGAEEQGFHEVPPMELHPLPESIVGEEKVGGLWTTCGETEFFETLREGESRRGIDPAQI